MRDVSLEFSFRCRAVQLTTWARGLDQAWVGLSGVDCDCGFRNGPLESQLRQSCLEVAP